MPTSRTRFSLKWSLLPLVWLGAVLGTVLGAGCARGTRSEVRPEGRPATSAVRPGIEGLLERPPAWMVGKRIGLISNHASVNRRGDRSVDLLAQRTDWKLTTLFAFEHGLRGDAPAGQRIASGVDEFTGLPVHSLYGDVHQPTPEMLKEVEVLVYDVQDVGARPYTRVSTMALSMQAAKGKGIPFVVLDRPNPLGGVEVEGPVLDPAFASFVGMYPIPLRHGMTVGELARMFNREFEIGADLRVIPVDGWRRAAWWDQTGLPWIAPSPNLRRLQAAIHYPGAVLWEGTNLSEGRGTDAPFEQIGAPWLRGAEVMDSMNAMRLPGIRFEPIRMVVAADARKWGGQTIPGVRLVLTDREVYHPVKTSLLLIELIHRLHPAEFRWTATIDRLAGSDRVRRGIEAGTIRELLPEWERDAERFRVRREPYLLYR